MLRFFITLCLLMFTINAFSQNGLHLNGSIGYSKEFNRNYVTEFRPAFGFSLNYGFSTFDTHHLLLNVGYKLRGYKETVSFPAINSTKSEFTDYHLITVGSEFLVDLNKKDNNFFLILGQSLNYLADTEQAFDGLWDKETQLQSKTIQLESKIGLSKYFNNGISIGLLVELNTLNKDIRKNYNSRDFFTGLRLSKRLIKATPNSG